MSVPSVPPQPDIAGQWLDALDAGMARVAAGTDLHTAVGTLADG